MQSDDEPSLWDVPTPQGWPVVERLEDFKVRPTLLGHHILVGVMPDRLVDEDFETLWNLHPERYPTITMYSKPTLLPRWQQAYGHDYYFSGQANRALPIPRQLQPYLDWAKQIHPAMNGLLLNWYDSTHGHYIGKHRDSTVGLVPGAPIITMSLGAARVFRLRPYRMSGGVDDVEVISGDVIAIPWDTNEALSHEVPHLERYPGCRISITARAFTTP